MTLTLTSTAAVVLQATAYHALVDGHGVITPALARMSAARADPVWSRRVLGAGTHTTRYLLDRPPRPSGVPAVDRLFPYAGELREATWRAARNRKHEVLGEPDPVWGREIRAALELAESVAVGPWLGMPELLYGLIHDAPDQPDLWRRLHAGGFPADTTPYAPFYDTADLGDALFDRANPPSRWIPRLMGRYLDSAIGGPVLAVVEEESRRQAVQLGHDVVQTSAVLLAVLDIAEQMRLTDTRFHGRYRRDNNGAALLTARGLTRAEGRRAAWPVVLEHAAEPTDDVTRLLFSATKPEDPVWTAEAIELFEEAGRLARSKGTKVYGTSHLVEALDTAPAPAAHRLLADLEKA
ncbi:hypothetical protein [Actinoplanes friuliensis]|uniref:Clp domain-containing protein n=1 Tax=Actinoplanes friuliensis DSM 7358 TaxID=1246995 RepID=U5VZZ9_9ACTN|nr:hypothetical protein [Actinoplanes friuliensis]AGZ42464.1 Clp domain-containing protein [Actinoplanes friuliensis DSM 7358]